MKVLVTGDRSWSNPNPIWAMLTGLYCLDSTNWAAPKFEPFVVIEGGAKGADRWAAQWCESPQTSYLHGPTLTPEQWEREVRDRAADELMFYSGSAQPVVHYQYPALWNTFGKSAGPRRNSEMIRLHPDIDLVLAYHDDLIDGSRGTKDMVDKAEKAGIEIWHLERFLPPIKLW